MKLGALPETGLGIRDCDGGKGVNVDGIGAFGTDPDKRFGDGLGATARAITGCIGAICDEFWVGLGADVDACTWVRTKGAAGGNPT